VTLRSQQLPATSPETITRQAMPSREAENQRQRVLRVALLAAITLIGAFARAPGLGAHGLYYDDAWFALASRVDLGSALNLSVTTPGFTLVEALWIRILPHSDTWAQMLPWLLGVATPLAAYVLGRTLRLAHYACIVMAAIVAISPAAIEYSVRVKEYEADFLLAALILVLVETTRRSERTSQRLAVLAVVSIVSVSMSASTEAVVVGAWIGFAVCALVDRRRTRAILAWSGATIFATVGLTLFITRAAPTSLTTYWQWQDRLFGSPDSWSHFRTVVGLSVAGLLHGVVGTPLPAAPTAFLLTLLVILGVLVLLWLTWPAIAAVRGRDGQAPDLGLLPAAFVTAVAVILFLAGKVPLGTGRTDLVLYPALLLLVGRGLERLVGAARRVLGPRSRRFAWGTGLVIAVVLGCGIAWHNRAWYPSQDVVSIKRQLQTLQEPADWTVVSYRNSFTWAYSGLSPWSVHHSKRNGAAATIGFWVTFDHSKDLAQLNGLYLSGPVPGLRDIPSSVKRLWFIGATAAVVSPSVVHPTGSVANQPIDLPSVQFRSYGWIPGPTRLVADGAYAQLYVRDNGITSTGKGT
jgi:hypothetical protein